MALRVSKAAMKTKGVSDSLAIGPCPTTNPGIHIADMIRETVEKKKDAVFASWYDIKGKKTEERTFSQIWEKAGEIAYYLHHVLQVKKGQRVVLCYYFGLHFFEVFFGCLRAGVVAILVYPPGRPLKKSLSKLTHVVEDCEPVLILTDSMVNGYRLMDVSNPLSKTRRLWPSHVKFHVTERLPAGFVYDEKTLGSDIAFLQYTSGSTGNPKGVMISFQALAANVTLLHENSLQFLPGDVVGFSWLPQYHDMGLILLGIAPLFSGWRMHMISPMSFIKNPLLWLELMSEYRVNTSAAPDFSFNYVVRKSQEARALGQSLPDLDLSSIVHLFSGAEPSRQETAQAFLKEFSSFGLRSNFYGVAYGLAETCVACCYVSGCKISKPREGDSGKTFVACGQLALLHSTVQLLIVDAETGIEVHNDETGELWLAGPSIATGYHNKPELTETTFGATVAHTPGVNFLRTGDLAFIQYGYLYICGRIKDLIIINGANYYPQDVEYVVQRSSDSIRQGCVAAFSAKESEGDLEIVFEVRDGTVDAASVCQKVRQEVLVDIGVAPGRVVAIAARSIPKTTSGKIQRRAARKALHEEKLEILASYQSTNRDGGTLPLPINNNSQCSITLNTMLVALLGYDFDEDSTWDELGLTSLMGIELQNQISLELKVPLSAMFQEEFPTPKALSGFIETAKRSTFPVKLESLTIYPDDMSWEAQSIVQAIGIALIVLVVAFSFVPAYQVGKVLASTEALNVTIGRVNWQWIPLVIPLWMLSLSLFTIFCKWLVIGKYKAQIVCVPSTMFVRWWFVDRVVHLWEIWIGSFLLDTPLLWLFYYILGVRIDPTVQVKAFIREFDLVEVGAGTSIEHPISCRRFRPWLHDSHLLVAFRSVTIGCDCKIGGMVGIGSHISDNCIVENLATVPEGCQVPKSMQVKGNYGIHRTQENQNVRGNSSVCRMATLKLTWQLFEVYFFAAGLLFCQWVLNGRLPADFRYNRLLFWCLVILLQNAVSIICAVVLKWVVIGKVAPGKVSSSVTEDMKAWVCDYRYMVTLHIFSTIASNSKITNVYLKALGMDIDVASHVFAYSFWPSGVDLISIKNSFLSAASVELSHAGKSERVTVMNCSFGYGAVLKGGTTVRNLKAPPLSVLHGERKSDEKARLNRSWGLIAFTEILYVVMLAVLFIGAIPSYEIATMNTWTAGVGYSVLKLAAAMLIQTLVWLLMYRVLQQLLYRNDGSITCQPLYTVYLTVTYNFMWVTSLLHLGYGTPFMEDFLRFMGSNVKGRVMYFADQTYDHSQLTFANRTVIDRCNINAHSVVYDQLWVAPVQVCGLLHQGTVVLADTDMTGAEETGPYQFFVSSEGAKRGGVEDDHTTVDDEQSTAYA